MPTITNRMNLPAGLVRAMELDPYSNEGSHVTASTLADPPLLQALKHKHEGELEEDASERIWALLGQAVHVIVDRGAQQVVGVESEKRLSMDVLGWKLSGAFDHFSLESGTLSDWKCTSAFTIVYGDRIADYEKQLNTLAHLLEHSGRKVTTLEIIAILRDWAARDVERVKNYPTQAVVVVPLKLWSKEKRQAYIEERVVLHQRAREQLAAGNAELIEPCSDEERWAKKDRKGVKTYIRCNGYCPVKKFCPVLAKERAAA